MQLDGRVGLDRVDKRQHGGRIDLLGRRRAPREVLAHDRSLRFGAHDVRHTHQGSLVAPQRCKHRDGHRLVETLATNAGRLCTHRFLLERVWGPGYGDESHYLRVYMANLRKKLDDPAAPQLLLTEPGMGYRFVVPDTDGTPAEA